MIKTFYYIQNIHLGGKFARSVQVKSNHLALKEVWGNRYRYVFPSESFICKLMLNDSSTLRKLLFHIFVFFKLFFSSKDSLIYSRNLSVLLLAQKLGKKIVWEAHDIPNGSNYSLLNLLISKNLFIVTISEALKKKIVKEWAAMENKICVAHDGVNIEAYDSIREKDKIKLKKEIGFPVDKKIFIHSGQIYEGRGAELFEVVLKNIDNCIFYQVGGSASDVEKWKNYYKQYSNIVFIPHQSNENLIKYQMASDYMFYIITKNTSTYWCCSPMKIFEFMATGNPIIGSNIGSLSEVINDQNCFCYDPENLELLKSSLKSAITSEKECKMRANKALADIREKYTWKIRAEVIKRFSEQMC